MVTRRRIGARGPNVRTITTSTSRTPSRVITRTVEKRGSKVRSIASSFRPRPPIRVSSRRKPTPIKATRVRPPPPQISSRPKPTGRPFGDDHILPNRESTGPPKIRFQERERNLIAFRPEGQSSREDLFSVGLDVGVGSRTNHFGFRIDGPRGTKKKVNKVFSPISQGVIGVQNNLTDAFNSRQGPFNNSPFIVGIRKAGRSTRDLFDNSFLGDF